MTNILVVDDSLADAALTIRAVRKTNTAAVISTAIDGEDAIHLMMKKQFDLVLLDMNMPHVDGFELLRRIRAGVVNAARVIAISGSRSVARQQEAQDLGANAYVYKAMDFDDFTNSLNTAIAKLT